MKLIKDTVVVLIFLVSTLVIVGCGLQAGIPEYNQSPQYANGAFNNDPVPASNNTTAFGFMKRYLLEAKIDAEPTQPIPLKLVSYQDVINLADDTPAIYRLGHSSLLLKIAGKIILIDPMFSQRASPFSFIGPKRFHPVPLNIDDFAEIDAVIISHDHYDHLDKQTIKKLSSKTKQFLVPLGVGKYLKEWGVASDKVNELDWWQNIALDEIKFTATPAQHFSGRGLSNRNETLWASWVITTPTHNIFYSGDGGYFDGFKKIGEVLGPFNLAILENGAYDENWPSVHMMPEQTIQAHKDLNADVLLPVHNSTFDLAFHPWYDPLEKLSALAQEQNISLATPVIGQPYLLDSEVPAEHWWKLN
ncbi:MAG: L-ascorbate metabolism protein UlaG (beta-lactamase superfamily) [Pseudomonadales bacterium]|jgi:L-ascorbate metabolism protein UlaG (beta-lactamase superfamily)